MTTTQREGVESGTRYARRLGWPSVEERFTALTVRDGEHLRWRGGRLFSVGVRPSGDYCQVRPQVYAWERATGLRVPPHGRIVSTCGETDCVDVMHVGLRWAFAHRAREAGVSRQAMHQRDLTTQARAALGGDWGPLSLTLSRQLRALGYADLAAVRQTPPEPHRLSSYLRQRLAALGIGTFQHFQFHACPECGARHRRPVSPTATSESR